MKKGGGGRGAGCLKAPRGARRHLVWRLVVLNTDLSSFMLFGDILRASDAGLAEVGMSSHPLGQPRKPGISVLANVATTSSIFTEVPSS
jgi:hypothetical protein